MSRLPNIGGDSGTWGSVLNDYLSQSLTSSGQLGTVTANGPATFLFSGSAPSITMQSGSVIGTASIGNSIYLANNTTGPAAQGAGMYLYEDNAGLWGFGSGAFKTQIATHGTPIALFTTSGQPGTIQPYQYNVFFSFSPATVLLPAAAPGASGTVGAHLGQIYTLKYNGLGTAGTVVVQSVSGNVNGFANNSVNNVVAILGSNVTYGTVTTNQPWAGAEYISDGTNWWRSD